MVDWNDIKNAFERDAQKAEDSFKENEQKLLKSISTFLCEKKGVSPIQGYDPEEVITFLDKTIPEIKSCIGGEWAAMSDSDLETVIYSLSKKVKKSGNIINW